MTGDETDPFALLADETRLSILRELAACHRESPASPEVAFSDLRERVGRRDSGNFNYHLDKLCGRFVHDGADGYRLTNAGLMTVASLLAGTYDAPEDAGPEPLAGACARCGEDVEAVYRSGVLAVRCESGHAYQNVLPPRALSGRSLADAAALQSFLSGQHVAFATRHGCPFCYGSVAWESLSVPEVENALAATCERCGMRLTVPVGATVVRHPAVVARFYADGIDVRDRALWTLDLCTDDAVERTPDGYRVAVPRGDEPLVLRVDESATVTEVVGPDAE